MFNEITMPPEAFLVVLGIAVLFGAKYVAMIVSAIVSVVLGILKALWLLIVILVLSYAVYYVLSNMSIS